MKIILKRIILNFKKVKKQYSLALGGGAVRGLAHIGVIKYLEEKNIIINEISGTSMGAIIASLYAIGETSNDMKEFAKNISYLKLIDISLGQGLLKGQKVLKKFEKIFGNITFEDIDIDLKIVATDVETGEKKVFSKETKGVRLVDAIRASLSLPGIFIPYKIGKSNYIDGGISNNLPIEILDGKNIIAVSALKKIDSPLKRKRNILGFSVPLGFLNMNFQILQRTVLLMMKQNEDRSINIKGKKVSLIYPVYGDLDFYSFNKVDEMIEVGYNESIKILKL